jgi:hypothetical protein
MHMPRFAGLTNAFTKKAENHAHAVALHSMYYNFCKIQASLRCSPAMETGVGKTLWADIATVIEEWEESQRSAAGWDTTSFDGGTCAGKAHHLPRRASGIKADGNERRGEPTPRANAQGHERPGA